jgi:hypothetical protein
MNKSSYQNKNYIFMIYNRIYVKYTIFNNKQTQTIKNSLYFIGFKHGFLIQLGALLELKYYNKQDCLQLLVAKCHEE